MHLGLFRREHLQSDDPRLIGSATTDQFQRTHGALQAWAEAEHKDDGAHAAIHADSIDVAGGIAAAGGGLFGGDVVALHKSGDDCGIGTLATVNGLALLPNEVVRQGLLLGGVAAGMFIERRAANAPYTSGFELAFWNLAIPTTGTIRPMFRIGLMAGVPTLLDGGSGVSLDLGDFADPIRNVVAVTLQATGNVFAGGGFFERGRPVAMGEWIPVAFNAANFTGNGSMTWTLQAGDQLGYAYTLVGKTMFISGYFNQTTVGGVVNTDLRVAIPGGFIAAGLIVGLARVNPAAGAFSAGTVYVTNGATTINFQTLSGANWVAGVDITAVQFSLAFPIQ